MQSAWKETMAGGTPQAERAEFEQLARDIMRRAAQEREEGQCHGVPHGVRRTLHAKRRSPSRRRAALPRRPPEDLRHGFASPVRPIRTIVRFSNAAHRRAGLRAGPARRGAAGHVYDGDLHDLLTTNFPVSHARDAKQFVEFAKATAGDRSGAGSGSLRLVRLFGARETVRMLRNVLTATPPPAGSVATRPTGAVARCAGDRRSPCAICCARAGTPRRPPSATDPDYLSNEAARRLAAGRVRMELCIQRYVDPTRPRSRTRRSSGPRRRRPPEPVAVLTIGRSDITTAEALTRRRGRRRARVQPVEHHRRVPAAGQPQPRPQGRRTTPAPPAAPATAGTPSVPRATSSPAAGPRRFSVL